MASIFLIPHLLLWKTKVRLSLLEEILLHKKTLTLPGWSVLSTKTALCFDPKRTFVPWAWKSSVVCKYCTNFFGPNQLLSRICSSYFSSGYSLYSGAIMSHSRSPGLPFMLGVHPILPTVNWSGCLCSCPHWITSLICGPYPKSYLQISVNIQSCCLSSAVNFDGIE